MIKFCQEMGEQFSSLAATTAEVTKRRMFTGFDKEVVDKAKWVFAFFCLLYGIVSYLLHFVAVR
jgi:hypothetical protein